MRRLASIAGVVLGALAFAAPALADNAGLTPVDPKSPNAEAINDTYYLLLGITGIVFFAVEIALVVFLLRYRRRGRPVDAEGPQIHGNTRLEVMWTVVPVLLVAIVVGFVFYKLPEVTDVTRAANAPADEPNLVIDVEGRRFHWEFRYPDGRITYDTMVVPVDRTVELNVTAPDFDVIHSWWIPALGGKIDAIPGKLNHTWFRAEEAGEYEGSCTEFCGLQHAEMRMIVRAIAADGYDAELTRLAGSGEAQFEATCAKCHNMSGPRLVGPNLGGNPTLADRESLATLLREGRGRMPAVGRGWSDEQLDTLFEYTRRAGGEQ
ncbi:MAG TPA: cytochrome c oxidase subunit II [Gaiellaceae bacterium]|nr:cytochrome c oxidase subunit II [Gaiellaceae bacterium]